MKIACITNSDQGLDLGELLRQRFEIPHVPVEKFIVQKVEDLNNYDQESIVIFLKDNNVDVVDSIEYKFTLEFNDFNKSDLNNYIVKLFPFFSENGLDDLNWKTKTGQESLIDHILNLENINWQCPCGQHN